MPRVERQAPTSPQDQVSTPERRRQRIEDARDKRDRARKPERRAYWSQRVAQLEAEDRRASARAAVMERRHSARQSAHQAARAARRPATPVEASENALVARLGRAHAAVTHRRRTEGAPRLPASWLAEIRAAAVRDGFEVGAVERALHGFFREDVDRFVKQDHSSVVASTDPRVAIGRRRRYGGDVERLDLPERLKNAARRYLRLAQLADRLGNMRSCLSSLETAPGDWADPDSARARMVRAARAFQALTARLSADRRLIGGAQTSERRIVQGVILYGVPVAWAHGGQDPARGYQKSEIGAMLRAGLARLDKAGRCAK